jgi:hypothetical protein
MAFTDFNSPDEVQQAYSITYCEEEFLHAAPKMPSDAFSLPEQPIYGIVTDAELWQFGRLTKITSCI